MLTEDAKTRLEAVAMAIEAEPKRIDMDAWLHLRLIGRQDLAGEFYPECGIVGCIAGWVVALSVQQDHTALRDIDDIGDQAQAMIGITADERNRLFYTEGWPEQFLDEGALFIAGRHEPQTPEYAAIVAKRIRYFIQTNGTDEENVAS